MTTFADRVRREREAREWSLQRLADEVSRVTRQKCGKSAMQAIEERPQQHSKWSRGIADALGVNHEWLTLGKGPKHPTQSLDKKLQLLDQEEYDEVITEFNALLDAKLQIIQARKQRR